jgi:hypothetical protein
MSIINLPFVQFGEFQSITLFEIESKAPNTYRIPLQVKGNSILSSLLVTELDPGASIKVNYFQTTSGNITTERSELTGHTIKTLPDNEADTIIVARMHSKPVCEVVIEGGNVKFGLMATMVSAFATDIESSLFMDNYIVQGKERGLPVMAIDDDDGQIRFLRSKYGKLITDPNHGDPLHLTHTGTLNKDDNLVIFSHQTFEKSLKISQFTAVSASDYRFTVFLNGELIVSARTSVNNIESDQHFDPYRLVPKNSLVTIKANRLTNTNDGTFDVYLRGYEFINPEEAEMSSLTKVVVNKSGGLILPFKAVAWKDDNSVALADADGIGLDDFAGVTQAGIANLGYGVIYKVGEVPGALVGKGAIAGQSVFLSSTPGELTLIAPPTGVIFRIGRAEPPSGGATGEATSLFIDPQVISEV